jgi:hypothetical protein
MYLISKTSAGVACCIHSDSRFFRAEIFAALWALKLFWNRLSTKSRGCDRRADGHLCWNLLRKIYILLDCRFNWPTITNSIRYSADTFKMLNKEAPRQRMRDRHFWAVYSEFLRKHRGLIWKWPATDGWTRELWRFRFPGSGHKIHEKKIWIVNQASAWALISPQHACACCFCRGLDKST